MTQPPFLRQGDTVIFIAPSGKVSSTLLKEGKEIIEKWGVNVIFGKNTLNDYYQFAGTDNERLDDLQSALSAKEVKAIFCARGGYGLTRIIDRCSFEGFSETPKWIIGFSDITALHLVLNKINIPCIHGPMPSLFSTTDKTSLNKLKACLFGEQLIFNLPYYQENRTGETQGMVTGGNLSLITHCLGTQSEIDCNEKILFLEEVDEYLYAVDRMMNQLYRAEKLTNLKGMIIGRFSEMKDKETPFGYSLEGIIKNWVSEFNFPVTFGMPAGHTQENHPLIFGKTTTLKVSKEGSYIAQ